jgi:hypothetical protein
MNERIKLLAEQATEYANEQNKLHGVGYVITFKDKFAEKIVKECAGKVDFILREKSNGGGTMGDEIREHFGVTA